jgi:hypothetical protein
VLGAVVGTAKLAGVVTSSSSPWFATGEKYGWQLEEVFQLPAGGRAGECKASGGCRTTCSTQVRGAGDSPVPRRPNVATKAAPTIVEERPIIMQAESVRGILAGRKTQTRRLLKEDQLKIRLPYDVKSDMPAAISRLRGAPGVHPAAMNPHGAVSIRVDGELLGVKPGEFDFVSPYVTGTTRLVDHVWLPIRVASVASAVGEGDVERR